MNQEKCVSLSPARRINLNKYIGKWYEIARTDNPYEKICGTGENGPIAEYTLKNDILLVMNSCVNKDSGEAMTSKGYGINLDPRNNSRFLVVMNPTVKRILSAAIMRPLLTFANGNYWIMYVEKAPKEDADGGNEDEEYSIAYVGTPDKKMLWLLARQDVVKDEVFQNFEAFAREHCFDVDSIIRVRN